MIICVQRVLSANVKIDGEIKGAVGKGLLVLLGVEKGDDGAKSAVMAEKVCNLRIFPDENGKMSLSVKDINGGMLIISQFTLAADTTKGNRPDFNNAAQPDLAKELYMKYIGFTQEIIGTENVSCGVFAANMQVSLVNDGPVTIIVRK